jgi:hypothetical protein
LLPLNAAAPALADSRQTDVRRPLPTFGILVTVYFKEVSMSKSPHPHPGEWQIVTRELGLLAAQTVQGRLETAGIPVVLDYDGMQSLLGVPAFGSTGEVRILVPRDRLAEARALLSG